MTNDGAQGFALRDMTLDDVAEGLRLSAAAGWNQRDADWRYLLERNAGRFVVAVEDGRVVGSGGAVVYGAELAWVCMILVDPATRGQGIGTRVVEGVLARLSDVPVVGLDATPAGRGLYVRLGFEDAYPLVRMEAPGLRASITPTPAGSSVAVEGIDARALDDVLTLDRHTFGADRGDLLRWAIRQAPALCVREGREITGYCFGRRGALSRQIGPVVARDLPAARALVRAARDAQGAATPASGTAGSAPVVLDAFDRPDWRAALEADGFRAQRPLVRMYRHVRPPGRPDQQFAVFGPEFG